jgi:hypothetical protein
MLDGYYADVIPPKGWSEALSKIQVGNLYGAHRYINGKRVVDGEIAGFFQLFHTNDINMLCTPYIPTQYYHAGNYDSELQSRWKHEFKRKLDIELEHLGDVGKNWCGVGNEHEVEKLHKNRKTNRVGWKSETVENFKFLK